MGKNSLVKSTGKKKSTGMKKIETPKPKGAPEITSTLKAPPVKEAAKPKVASDKEKKETAPSRESLIFKKFDSWQPDQLYVPRSEKKAADFSAPPFFTGKTEAETEELRALLFKKFDLKELPSQPPPEKPAQKPSPEKTESAIPAPVSEKPSPPVKKVEPKPDTMPAEEKGKKKTMKTEKTQALPAADEPKKMPEEEVIHYQPPTPFKGADPVDRTMKFVIAGFGLLILVLIAVSASNSKSYAIKPANGGIEIWKGSFAPIGEKRFMVLSGMQAPEPLKSRYSQEEAFSLTFDYYLNKADALLDVSGIPDLEGIRQYLKTASSYATNKAQQVSVNKRLNNIDYMLLIYRADVALGKGTLDGAENAIAYLEQAGSMEPDKNQIEIVKGRMDAARKIVADLKAKAQTKSEAQSPSPVEKK